MPRYDHKRVEPKWQQYWDEQSTFQTPDDVHDPQLAGKKKLYVLDMFPYPSGDGLHVGHPEGYTATDIICRYSRMRGKNVLHPMGWDAFGLPAEQHAVKTGTHPRVTTYKNIETFRRQLKMLGFSYDWSREFSTTDPDYFRWTQWIFLQIFDTWYDPELEWTGPDGRKRTGRGRPIAELPIPDEVRAQGEEAVRRYQDRHRLAYQHEAPVNWCAELRTVLSNEEIVDGRSERGGYPVQRIPLRQWMLQITAYADRLLEELEDLDWPESVKALQRNWIGRSEGAEVDFYIGESMASGRREPAGPSAPIRFDEWKAERQKSGFPTEPGEDVLRVYTTRPDTLFGATYMVLAPEHPVVDRLTTPEQQPAVNRYREQASLKSDLDRTDLAKEKTGVFTGSYAVNPVNSEKIPIWIADYVLVSYGTGAIMAVPAHDTRDMEFAQTMGLPIRRVVDPPEDEGWSKQFLRFCESFYEDPEYTIALHIPRNNPDCSESTIRTKIKNTEVDERLIEIHQVDDDGIYVIGKNPLQSLGQFQFSPPYNQKGLNEAYTFEGIAINSANFDGLSTTEFKEKITADLSGAGLGRKAVNFRLRDWLFSRQHFWGEPFPIWHELDADGNLTGLMRTDPEDELPVELPEEFDFNPHGRPEPPLDEAPDTWLYKTASDGTRLKRETNSMPQWAGSCWYYIRFCDPKNGERFIDPEKEKYWLPVDLYIGGAEHAVLHLLYARFWHKVLFDRGHLTTPEPFRKLVNQGMILGETMHRIFIRFDREPVNPSNLSDEEKTEALLNWYDQQDGWRTIPYSGERLIDIGDGQFEKETLNLVSAPDAPTTELQAEGVIETLPTGDQYVARYVADSEIEKRGDTFVLKEHPEIETDSRAYKMSKSRGNVINPDDIVDRYGADALRMYEMFMGPLEQMKPWSMSGVEGVSRFIGRVWRMIVDSRADEVVLNPAVQDVEPDNDQLRILHKTIKSVTGDIEKLSFNRAISRMMEFTNEVGGREPRPKAVLEPFVLLLAPFAPHIAEELWEVLGHEKTLAYEPWPAYDESLIAESEIEIPVQVNGKLRSKVQVPADADRQTIQQTAEADETIAKYLKGKTVVKVIVVPGRLVNFVVKG